MALLHQQPNSPYWDEKGNRTVYYDTPSAAPDEGDRYRCDGTCDTCPASCFYRLDGDSTDFEYGTDDEEGSDGSRTQTT